VPGGNFQNHIFFINQITTVSENNKQAEEVKKPTSGHTFTATTGEGDKAVTTTYKTTLAIMVIPGINDGKPITSLEVSKSKEAQQRLLELGAVGSVLEVVAK
jgi:hypothetical protein